jgi:hypothetical protein
LYQANDYIKYLPLYAHMLPSIILTKTAISTIVVTCKGVVINLSCVPLNLINLINQTWSLVLKNECVFSSRSPSLKMTSAFFNLSYVLRQYVILTEGWVRG